MNMIRYRFELDRKMDEFVRENYDDISAKDNFQDRESLFFNKESAQT